MTRHTRSLAVVSALSLGVLAAQIALPLPAVALWLPLLAVLVASGTAAFGGVRPAPAVGILLAGACVSALAVHLAVLDAASSDRVATIALLASVGVCAIAGALRSRDRLAGLLLAAGVVGFAASLARATLGPPFTTSPEIGQLGFLLFPPFALAAVILYVARRLPGAGATVWLDIAIGGVAFASLADFLLIGPGLDSTLSPVAGGPHFNTLADYLLLGVLAAALAASGGHLGRRLLVLSAGLALLTLADTSFIVTLVDRQAPELLTLAAWPAALVVLAWTPWASAHAPKTVHRSRVGPLLPAMAAPLALPVVIFGDPSGSAWEVVNLGLGLLVLCLVAVRLLLTLRDNAALLARARADASRTAAILGSAGGGIVGVDTHGVVSFANPAALALVGHSEAYVVGRPWHEVLTVDGDMLAVALADTLVAGTAQPPADLVLVGHDGWRTAVQCTTTPVDLDGCVAGAVVTVTDVSERKAAEAAVRSSEEHLVRAQQLAGIGSWEWQAATNAVHWSDQQALLHNLDPTFIPRDGEEFFELILDEDRADVRAAIETAWTDGVAVDVDYRLPVPEGVRLIRLAGERMLDADGEPVGLYGTSQDVTDRLRREEAERANRAKSEFLSRMSHELRTPLNAILGFGQLLERSELNGRQSASVGQILTAGTHLLGLIDEVLDVARIEAGRLSVSVEPVDVAAVVREVAELTATLAAERGIRMHVELPPEGAWVRADAQRLRQVVLNLVSNGVKYNRDDGALRLAVTLADAEVRLTVSDSGRGIEPRDLTRLFTAFERLGADGGFVEGTGLGLAVTKGLVEAMEGRIDVESTVGVGTTFRLAFPAGDVHTLADAAGPPDVGLLAEGGTGGPVHRLLCIEDNPSNFALVQGILGGRGDLELTSATDAASGLAALREHVPDLVLLDLNLPDRHGADVLRELRADPATATTPVVVLSADATHERRADALAAGADVYLTKPLDVLELLTTVEDVLSRAA